MMLKIPPRVREESDNKSPMTPRMIAKAARNSPKMAPVLKLKITATIERMDGMLKAALPVLVEFIGANHP